MGRRRLYFDIETSPNIGLFWEAGRKKTIDYENIIKERAVICICYKWEGEKQINSLTWDGRQNDKKMLQEFIKVANSAVELVAHNGDKFDLAWIRTRCLLHKIEMFPSYVTIDTLKVARSKFRFNSNRLNYIAQFLGIGSKIKTEYGLWKDIVLKNDKKALERMVKYCKKDVQLLEDVFYKISSHVESKVHYGVLSLKSERVDCPHCGSDDHRKVNLRTTTTGMEKRLLQCNTCHNHFTVSKSLYDNKQRERHADTRRKGT